jgi:hypothetical protein
MKNHKMQVVEEAAYGVYVWEMPNGQWVGDELPFHCCHEG